MPLSSWRVARCSSHTAALFSTLTTAIRCLDRLFSIPLLSVPLLLNTPPAMSRRSNAAGTASRSDDAAASPSKKASMVYTLQEAAC